VRTIASIAIILSASAGAQTPQFEVASVKLSPDQRGLNVSMHGGPGTEDPGLYTCENCEIWGLIDRAFDLKAYQLSGPVWMRTTRLIISAKIPAAATKEEFRLMLQDLLIERFKLTFHREKKEMPTYDLVVAKNGPRLKESPEATPSSDPSTYKPPSGPLKKDKDGFPIIPPEDPRPMMSAMEGPRWVQRFGHRSMEQLAGYVATLVDRPVEDATGLKGQYDFTLKWINDRLLPPDDNTGPNIFAALQAQLGLKLESKKGMVDVLVIDHIEKTPTEN
jgi:uncharacterized protein (TIGR03435 family)